MSQIPFLPGQTYHVSGTNYSWTVARVPAGQVVFQPAGGQELAWSLVEADAAVCRGSLRLQVDAAVSRQFAGVDMNHPHMLSLSTALRTVLTGEQLAEVYAALQPGRGVSCGVVSAACWRAIGSTDEMNRLMEQAGV